jgi:hypothetical protein
LAVRRSRLDEHEDENRPPRGPLYDKRGELIRAAPLELAGELAEVVSNYRSMTGGPYDLYLADRQRPELQGLTPLWYFQPVKALAGGEVWKEIVTGMGCGRSCPG